jgi:Na+/H+ antiporter NhaD/arsenite permease-like protein
MKAKKGKTSQFQKDLGEMRLRVKRGLVVSGVMLLLVVIGQSTGFKMLINVAVVSLVASIIYLHWQTWGPVCPKCSGAFCVKLYRFFSIRPWTTSCLSCGFKIKPFKGKYA